jgi:hypothetical protein
VSTILGEHISIVRPRCFHKPIVPKEKWRIKYNKRPKTRKFTEEELQELKSKLERG